MAFTKLSPPAKVKPGTFRVSCTQFGRKGDNSPWRLQISIPSAEFTSRFGIAEHFDILLGDGPDAGKMLIRADEGGAFRATALKSCFILRLPPTETTPQTEFRGEDPERRMTADGLLVELPEWAWKPGRWQEILAARATARRQNAAEAGRKG